jgi:uncharacterized membrane protein (UPF0127 family)
MLLKTYLFTVGRLGLLIMLFLIGAPRGAESADPATSALTIETTGGARHLIVEEALTAEQQERGLMYRRSLALDRGMLFQNKTSEITTFWMKNTLIPLDMLFIAADGRIVGIHERAVPLQLDLIQSPVPVLAALEINGGSVARLGIHLGDRVVHPIFAGARP